MVGVFLKGNGAGAMQQQSFGYLKQKNQGEVSTFNGKSEVHCSCFPAFFLLGGGIGHEVALNGYIRD